MLKVIDLIYDENGFQVKLRCDNYFDVGHYEKIKTAIKVENVCMEIEDIIRDLIC